MIAGHESTIRDQTPRRCRDVAAGDPQSQRRKVPVAPACDPDAQRGRQIDPDPKRAQDRAPHLRTVGQKIQRGRQRGPGPNQKRKSQRTRGLGSEDLRRTGRRDPAEPGVLDTQTDAVVDSGTLRQNDPSGDDCTDPFNSAQLCR